MSFSQKLEEGFWNNLEKEEFILDGKNTSPLDEVIKLLTLDEPEIEKEMTDKPELKRFLGLETIYTSEQKEESSDSDNGYMETIRMNKEEDASASINKPRSPLKRTREERDIPDPYIDEVFGMKILNLDRVKSQDMMNLINLWSTELSLLIQINRHAYPDTKNVLLLVEHKTAGSVQQFVQSTKWNATDPLQLGNDVVNAITYMFIGTNINSEVAKEEAIREIRGKARLRLKNLQICDICYIDAFINDYEQNLYELHVRCSARKTII